MSYKRFLIFVLVLASLSVAYAVDNSSLSEANQSVMNLSEPPALSDTILEIWDSSDSDSPYYVGNASTGLPVSIYADYHDVEDEPIPDGCMIYVLGARNTMPFVESISLFNYTLIFDDPGTYAYNITCNSTGFVSQQSSKEIQVYQHTPPVIDEDNDTYPYSADCNDHDPDVNPGNTEVLYNAKDDDCDPGTIDFLVIAVTPGKEQYSRGEVAGITLSSADGADMYVAIKTPSNASYMYSFSRSIYPVSINFIYTNKSGEYRIDATSYYSNYTMSSRSSFFVGNDMSVTIKANSSEAYIGHPVKFSSEIAGGVPPYSYNWDMGDGKAFSESSPIYSFSRTRPHAVTLRVTDKEGNQAASRLDLDVQQPYGLTLRIKNIEGAAIEDALVKVGHESEETDESGTVYFILANVSYNVKVTADDYEPYSSKIKMNSSHDITIILESEYLPQVPVISLKSPEDGFAVEEGSAIDFSFIASSPNLLNCTVYMSEGSGWFTAIKDFFDIHNTESAFQMGDLTAGNHSWKVECRDKRGTYSSSQKNSFIIEKKSVAAEEAAGTSSAVQQVYDLLPDFEEYSPDQKAVVGLLNIDERLRQSKLELDRANRDLYNLKYRSDLPDVLAEHNRILGQIEDIRDKTPRTIEVTRKAQYLRYLDPEAAEDLTEKYILIDKDQSKQHIIDAQKLSSASVSAYQVQIEMLSGRKEDYTVVEKTLTSSSEGGFVEYIPAGLSSEEPKILSPHAALGSGFYRSQESRLIYYFEGTVPLDEIPKAKTLFIPSAQKVEDKMTGFAIFPDIQIDLKSNMVLYLELGVIGILLATYLLNRSAPVPKDNKFERYGYANRLLQEADESLKAKNIEIAASRFEELHMLVPHLSAYHRTQMLPQLTLLADELNKEIFEKTRLSFLLALSGGDAAKAREIYELIAEEYPSYSERLKEQVYPVCAEMKLMLQMRGSQ